MRISAISCLAACLVLGFTIDGAGQSGGPAAATSPSGSSTTVKASLTPADYGQWETLQTVGLRGGLSPDGRWLAYGINRSNRNNELRVTNIADGTTKTAAFGAQPVFSSNSLWIAYSIALSETQEEKLRKDKKPVHKKLGLMNLQTGTVATVDEIDSFAFDARGAYLVMRRYEPEKKPSGDSAAPPASESDTPAGATLIVRNLTTGADLTFGNVAEYAWQGKGRLLAIAIATEDKTGNGVQLLDPENGLLKSLDSSAAVYSGLAWRKESADLAVLRSKADDRRDGPTHSILAWTHVGESAQKQHVYDPGSDARFPPGLRIVSFRKPSWSDDGHVVFVGISKWIEAVAPIKKSISTEAVHDQSAAPGSAPPAAEEDEPAGVDIWHSADVDVMPKQKVGIKGDRERNMLSAWHLETGSFVQLGKALTEQVTLMRHQPTAYVADWTTYAMDRSIGRPAADLSLIDIKTGERTRVKERVDDRFTQVSPDGKFILFLQDDHYFTINTATRAIVDITKSAATSFVDRESDQTVRQKPPFGVAGWLAKDEAVILYDKFDLWRVAPDGSKAVRLTDGAAELIRYRYVRLNPDDEAIDASRPMYVSAFGLWGKKSGYARLRPDSSTPERLVWLDKSVQRMAKAKDAEVYAYVAESFVDSPDVYIGGADLQNPKQVTHTNPFQEQFAWGREELIEYKNDRGERLQGAVYYPADYEAGKRYPTIVYMYEKLSDGLHRYVSPDERSSYNVAAFTSLGYLVLQPDIVFRPRDPGLSVVDCVGNAVKKIVQLGLADPRKVGVVGHSWGGFDASFLATHSDMFAAAVAGAPITDLVSNYGNHHWSSGIAETDHIETGQQRMEVPLWEDLPAYIRNSAVFNAQNMKTPLLIEVGDADGTVFWHQGVELYNIARRAKKTNVILLNYAGEDHGLRKKPNQLDYHRRIVEWFGHYLKDEAAPAWITSGVSYLQREQELKAIKARKPRASGSTN
jgi:dienelactone hydrolase